MGTTTNRLANRGAPFRRWAALGARASAAFALCALTAAGGVASAQEISREDTASCLACHETPMEGVRAVDPKGLAASPHADLKCQDCHTTITAAPHTAAMKAERASCGMCHTDPMTDHSASVHARKDKQAGDHPTCVSCHGKGGDPHSVRKHKLTRQQATILCSKCHQQVGRMARYGIDKDAVPSYRESFHGKALLRYGLTKAAGCVDCHGNHKVLSPDDAAAPTHRNNAAKTCGQAGCHAGAKTNFAMSGANHLRLKLKQSPVLRLEALFFEWLTIGTMLFLMGGIGLDLRAKVLTRRAMPLRTRVIAGLIAISFTALVAALAMALLGFGRPRWTGIGAVILLGTAFLVYLVTPKPVSGSEGEKEYTRLSLAQRVQHVLLFLSFILLVLTGMPLRFAEHPWMHSLYALFGGIHSARIIHRASAVVMIGTWIWHSVYLLYRWKKAGFKLSSWTMFPTLKDVGDFIGLSKFYFGLAKEPPKFDRFEFRQKFDYFAVYWGMPIMVFSGLVLWFPIYFGNRLHELGLGAAYIAHSDEAILAFLAIAVWHFYNAHFNPSDFPMSYTWWTGRKTRAQMEHEHPLELERIDKGALQQDAGGDR